MPSFQRAFLCFLALTAFVQIGVVHLDGQNAEKPKNPSKQARIIFLHHSTGQVVWDAGVEEWFHQFNAAHGTDYQITEQVFPNEKPYGWNNYPFDYWNIWVKHAGPSPFQAEPTLEILAKDYDVIVFKHCFPVSEIEEEEGAANIESDVKRIGNYKLQYQALKAKLRRFPGTRFILWTGPANVKAATSEEAAGRAREFFSWVRKDWDEKGDNIFLWDFYQLETEGGLFLKSEYAAGNDDSHPHPTFAKRVVPLFGKRVVDVIEGRGDSGALTGR